MSKYENQPLNKVVWRKRDILKCNNYNTNKVATPELKLLMISIIEDGWTQPIVINEDFTIVDGFHRWTVSKEPKIYGITDGYVPTVMLSSRNESSQRMSTIRHNRARGTHGVLPMSKIVSSLISEGLSVNEIMARLGMEKEEVIRLCFRDGISKSKILENSTFSKPWTPE